MDDETEEKIWMHALRNAILHDGEANVDAVLGGVMSENEGLDPKDAIENVKEVVEEINELPLEVQEEEASEAGRLVKKLKKKKLKGFRRYRVREKVR